MYNKIYLYSLCGLETGVCAAVAEALAFWLLGQMIKTKSDKTKSAAEMHNPVGLEYAKAIEILIRDNKMMIFRNPYEPFETKTLYFKIGLML